MASNATITLNDGASTPVAHAFDPAGIYGEVAKYQNKVAASFDGRETLQLKLKHSTKVRTVTGDIRIPRTITETVNGVDVVRVVDYMTVRVECLIPLSWDSASAKNGRVIGSNLLANSAFALMVEQGEFVW